MGNKNALQNALQETLSGSYGKKVLPTHRAHHSAAEKFARQLWGVSTCMQQLEQKSVLKFETLCKKNVTNRSKSDIVSM